MLDIQFIRDNPELVVEKSRQKGYVVDIEELLALDRELRERLPKLDELYHQRNEWAAKFKSQKPTSEEIEAGKKLKENIKDATERYGQYERNIDTVKKRFDQLLKSVPNMPIDDVPVGTSEEQNVVAKTVGEPKKFDFGPKNHWELTVAEALIDKQRAAKVAGSRFTYLKGDLVLMQFALVQFALQTLTDTVVVEKLIKDNQLNLVPKPFTPVLPPALVNTKAYMATTRLDAENVTYKLADDELWLNASAGHSLCNMYMDEIVSESELPIRYLGYATSFRREAGTYGKDTEGTIRMHQFDKLEMEVFSTPETGLEEHKLLIAVQEHLMESLGLPYQVLQKCTADIGKPNARGVDIEVYFPGQSKYRETHTADYMTDYQARSLQTRLRRTDNRVELVHTNDATALAFPRLIAAILENYQTKDGHVVIPEALRPFMAGRSII